MLTAMAAALALAGLDAESKPKVIAASLFKNGYAVTVREIPLAGGNVFVEAMPLGSLGTLWITGSKGVKFEEIVNTTVQQTVQSEASSLDQLLAMNVGKTLTISLNSDGSASGRKASGKLLGSPGQLVLLEDDGKVQALQKAWVTGVTSKDGGLQWASKTTVTKRGLRIKAQTPADGKAYIAALERGATWFPAYALDITDPKKLKITAKATIINELDDFDGIEVKLVTGFPNLPFAGIPDPFTSPARLDEFVSGLMRAGTPPAWRDGGMGGGALMTQNALRADFRGSFDDAFALNPLPVEQIEDLFFYRQPGVRLKTGDRGYFVLFTSECPYEHLYTWNSDLGTMPIDANLSSSPENALGDVWHCLKFKNETKQPFTTAPATTFKDGEILGQDTMAYTSPGAEALVKITKALDIRAERKSEEVARERAAIKDNNGNPIWDLATVKETFLVSNRKTVAVKLRVTRTIRGDSVSTDPAAKDVKTAQGLNEINPTHLLEWNVEVAPGKTATLTCTYKAYVHTGR